MTVSLPFLHYSEQFYLPTSCTAQNYNVKIKVWMKLKFLQIRQFKLNAQRQNNYKLLCYATILTTVDRMTVSHPEVPWQPLFTNILIRSISFSLIFIKIIKFRKIKNTYHKCPLQQGFPTHGPRPIGGPPSTIQWATKMFQVFFFFHEFSTKNGFLVENNINQRCQN